MTHYPAASLSENERKRIEKALDEAQYITRYAACYGYDSDGDPLEVDIDENHIDPYVIHEKFQLRENPVAVIPWSELPDIEKDPYREMVISILGDSLYCERVWDAWYVGTMTESDFYPLAEDSDYVEEQAEKLYKFKFGI